LIDAVVAGELPEPKPMAADQKEGAAPSEPLTAPLAEAARERPSDGAETAAATGQAGTGKPN